MRAIVEFRHELEVGGERSQLRGRSEVEHDARVRVERRTEGIRVQPQTVGVFTDLVEAEAVRDPCGIAARQQVACA